MRPSPRPAAAERVRRRPLLPTFIVALSWACLAHPASAQMAGRAALESDYRVRGVSFSDGRPVASLTLSYDHASGAYLGATGLIGAADGAGVRALGYQVDLGYARQTASGLGWDVGLTQTGFSEYRGSEHEIRYSEIYAGIVRRNLSAHLYYSPSYLGGHVRTLYAEVDGAIRPAPRWRLFAHAGLLTPLSRDDGAPPPGTQYDLRAGAAVEVRAAELRLAWTHVGPGSPYPAELPRSRDAVVVSASYAF